MTTTRAIREQWQAIVQLHREMGIHPAFDPPDLFPPPPPEERMRIILERCDSGDLTQDDVRDFEDAVAELELRMDRQRTEREQAAVRRRIGLA